MKNKNKILYIVIALAIAVIFLSGKAIAKQIDSNQIDPIDPVQTVKNYTKVLAPSLPEIASVATPKKEEPKIVPQAQDNTKYIEINLSKQTLYAFENGQIINSFLISGGLMGATPTGTFSIYSKNASVTMAGPGYYLPGVPWVSWFTGPYSIHGTYWHSNFGHPMSHGCVNASTPNALWIYNWAPVGTKVIIHY